MILLEVKVDLTLIPLLQIASEFPVKSGGPEQEAQTFHGLTPTRLYPLICVTSLLFL